MAPKAAPSCAGVACKPRILAARRPNEGDLRLDLLVPFADYPAKCPRLLRRRVETFHLDRHVADERGSHPRKQISERTAKAALPDVR